MKKRDMLQQHQHERILSPISMRFSLALSRSKGVRNVFRQPVDPRRGRLSLIQTPGTEASWDSRISTLSEGRPSLGYRPFRKPAVLFFPRAPPQCPDGTRFVPLSRQQGITARMTAAGKAEPPLYGTIGTEAEQSARRIDVMYRLLIAGLLTVMLGSALLLRPTPASSTESCIASVAAASACSFQCIGDIQLLCGPANPACLQANAQFLRLLASTPADDPLCSMLLAQALAVTHNVCGC
jgi:hypothetical protein